MAKNNSILSGHDVRVAGSVNAANVVSRFRIKLSNLSSENCGVNVEPHALAIMNLHQGGL